MAGTNMNKSVQHPWNIVPRKPKGLHMWYLVPYKRQAFYRTQVVNSVGSSRYRRFMNSNWVAEFDAIVDKLFNGNVPFSFRRNVTLNRYLKNARIRSRYWHMKYTGGKTGNRTYLHHSREGSFPSNTSVVFGWKLIGVEMYNLRTLRNESYVRQKPQAINLARAAFRFRNPWIKPTLFTHDFHGEGRRMCSFSPWWQLCHHLSQLRKEVQK